MGRACHSHGLRFALGLLVVLLCACSEPVAKQKGLTDADLFSRGMKKFAEKGYSAAIEHFQVLLERFPASPLAPRAQLALADAKRERGEFPEAETAYDDFLRLYPAHDNASYALYQKGELLFRQAAVAGRDQTKTVEAIKAFAALVEKNPTSGYAAKAAGRVTELRSRLAQQEAIVVRHYISAKKYDSAEFRAKRAIEEYKETAAVPSLMTLLAETLDKEGKKAEAAEVRKSLEEKFPQSGAKKK